MVLRRLDRDIGRFPEAPDNLSPVGNRAPVAKEVQISAVGCLCRIGCIEGEARLRFTVTDLPDSCFSQIVPRRPVEVADQIRQLLHQGPVDVQVSGIGLRADKNTVRVLFRILLITSGGVVVTGDINLSGGFTHRVARIITVCHQAHHIRHIAHELIDLARHSFRRSGRLPTCDRSDRFRDPVHNAEHQVHAVGDAPCGIQAPEGVRQLLAPLGVHRIARLGNLIADGIQDHAGMVVILADDILQVILPPVRHMHAVVKFHLRGRPHVRELIHHIHALTVAGLQKGSAHRIMGAPDRVETCLFQLPNPELFRVGKLGGSDHTVVMMQAAAAQLHRLPVHAKSPPAVDRDHTDSESSLFLIQNGSVFQKLCLITAKLRILFVPEAGMLHRHLLPVDALRAFPQGNVHGIAGNPVPVRPEQFHVQIDGSRSEARVFQLRLCPDQRQVIVQGEGADLHSVRNDVGPFRDHQIHIPVNAAARVPASARDGVLHFHPHVIAAGFHEIGQVQIKVAVAVGMLSGESFVHIDKSIFIDAFKLQEDRFPEVLLLQLKILAVNVILRVEESVSAPVRLIRIARRQDLRVMGKIHLLRLPGSAADHREDAPGTLLKGPVLIETDFLHMLNLPFINCRSTLCILPSDFVSTAGGCPAAKR